MNDRTLSRRLASAALVALVGLMVFAPLPFGSARPWAVALLELWACIAAILCWGAWLVSARGSGRSMSASFIVCVVAWMLWLAFVWLQMSEAAWPWLREWARWQRALYQTLSAARPWAADQARTLSINPGLTRRQWVFSVALFFSFMCVYWLCKRSPRWRQVLLWTLLLSGVAQAVFGSLMYLTGLDYGFLVKKTHYLNSATGTYVNRNHFAGYLELSLAAGLGLWVVYSGRLGGSSWRRRLRNLLEQGLRTSFIQIAILVLFVGLILSKSRMGNAAALAGILGLVIIGLLVSRHQRNYSWRLLLLLVAIVVVDLLIVGGWFGLEGLLERFGMGLEDNYRFKMWPGVWQAFKAYFWLGSGLGTFAVAYPEFHPQGLWGLPTHAHNDYLEFLIEVGVVGVLPLLVIVLLTIRHSFQLVARRRDPVVRGVGYTCLAALIMMGLHSTTSFNLQIPANAFIFVLILGLSWSCSNKSKAVKS